MGMEGTREEENHEPPFSIPFTAASEMVLSTVLAVSFAASTAVFRTKGVVERKRVRVGGRDFRGRRRRVFIVVVGIVCEIIFLGEVFVIGL